MRCAPSPSHRVHRSSPVATTSAGGDAFSLLAGARYARHGARSACSGASHALLTDQWRWRSHFPEGVTAWLKSLRLRYVPFAGVPGGMRARRRVATADVATQGPPSGSEGP